MTGEGRNPDRMPLHARAIGLPDAAIREPVRPLDPPVPVTAWNVRQQRGWTLLDGVADAYTPVAGYVRYVDEHGREDDVWVWAGAIERRQ